MCSRQRLRGEGVTTRGGGAPSTRSPPPRSSCDQRPPRPGRSQAACDPIAAWLVSRRSSVVNAARRSRSPYLLPVAPSCPRVAGDDQPDDTARRVTPDRAGALCGTSSRPPLRVHHLAVTTARRAVLVRKSRTPSRSYTSLRRAATLGSATSPRSPAEAMTVIEALTARFSDDGAGS